MIGVVGRCRLGRLYRNAVPDDHSRLTNDQIRRQRRQPIAHAVRPAVLDRDVLAFDESGFLQALPEGGHEVDRVGEPADAKKSDHRHRRLLRACRERPRRCRAAEKGDELASQHVRPRPRTRYRSGQT
ncbi:MAG: hypothetical protein ACJ8DY_12510 [Xanthobacteraceae bacterium]